MLAIGLFEPFAKLLAWFYSFTNNYILAISLIALMVMIITAPLVLKSTKGMLEMQKLQPQMKRLQALHRGDRQKLNEEMMKLYQEHKVNPLASCLPLVLQFPVFIIMYRVLHGLTNTDSSKGAGFQPLYLDSKSKLYESLHNKTEMLSWGLDLAKRPYKVLADDPFGKGLIYAVLVVALGALYFWQQKMVAARATVAPSMSATQQKLMQYLPVVFAFFLFFYLTGLVIYYMAQAVFRIGLQYYITRKFYHGEESLGRLAIAAGHEAREINKEAGGGGGLFGQAKRTPPTKGPPPKGPPGKGPAGNGARPKGPAGKGAGSGSSSISSAGNGKGAGNDASASDKGSGNGASVNGGVNKRTTQPKGRPTSGARPASTGRASRPGGGTRPPKKK